MLRFYGLHTTAEDVERGERDSLRLDSSRVIENFIESFIDECGHAMNEQRSAVGTKLRDS